VTGQPTSAGICSKCGKHAEKRYGGEGRFLPECLDCWIAGWEQEIVVAEAIQAQHDYETDES
jgi:hypothetical protein